jgi:hypothetical protein
MQIAKLSNSGDKGTKPMDYYEFYDDFLDRHNLSPRTILEIGTFQGESTKIFSLAFPNSRILTVDLSMAQVDFSGYNNIVPVEVDQTDIENLSSVINEHFPLGIDLIIDDASHIGSFTKITMVGIFHFLNSGGVYIIEDWGTGYWTDWPDGQRYEQPTFEEGPIGMKMRHPSHDYGMVGFVKSLIDLIGIGDIRRSSASLLPGLEPIRVLEIRPGTLMMIKA